MPRTIVQFPYTSNRSETKKTLEEYLKKHGYVQVQMRKGEDDVWQRGAGFVTSPRFIKIEFVPTKTVKLSAWVAGVGFGRRSVGEMQLKGFYAFFPKMQTRKTVEAIQKLFEPDESEEKE